MVSVVCVCGVCSVCVCGVWAGVVSGQVWCLSTCERGIFS